MEERLSCRLARFTQVISGLRLIEPEFDGTRELFKMFKCPEHGIVEVNNTNKPISKEDMELVEYLMTGKIPQSVDLDAF